MTKINSSKEKILKRNFKMKIFRKRLIYKFLEKLKTDLNKANKPLKI